MTLLRPGRPARCGARRRGRRALALAVALGAAGACSSPPKATSTATPSSPVVTTAGGAAGSTAGSATSGPSTATTATTAPTATAAKTTAGLASALGLAKLALGDGKYGSSPRKGYVDSCSTRFGGGGAFRDGPWIDTATGTWDAGAKIAVQGSVDHRGSFSVARPAGGEVLTGNGLPTVPTGTFPVAPSDPAYQYDRNPNSVQGYTLAVTLPEPQVAPAPSCVGHTVGVSTLGVPIYDAFDALGRDAAAHEVQDGCAGHPERTGQYHYHSLSPCWHDAAGFDPGLFGYALDGFGIYVERDAKGALPTTADLDECHGRTSEITWHGRKVSMYHYVATPDFPYLVGCYRGTAVGTATGLHLGGP